MGQQVGSLERARRCLRRRFFSGALFAATAMALPFEANAAASAVPEVTVEAQREVLEHEAMTFVQGLTRNTGYFDDSLIRWNSPICFSTAGFPDEQAQPLIARLSQIATTAGAGLAAQPCEPNFVIIATSDPRRVIAEWRKKDMQIFGEGPPKTVRRFVKRAGSRPIDLWHNVSPTAPRGIPYVANMSFPGQPTDTHAEDSRIAGGSGLSMVSVFAIVDTRRTEHMSLDAIADYVALTGLTKLDPDTDPGSAPTILRLFGPWSDSTGTAGLSEWDAAFLKALYHTEQSSRLQRWQIMTRVLHDVAP